MKNLERTNSICPPPETVLFESVKKNEVETIKTLITANRSLLSYEYPFTSKNILCSACSEDCVEPETIAALLDLGADVAGNKEWKPLHLAVENPKSSILETILKYLKPGQINETVDHNTALHSLVKHDNAKKNETLFEKHVALLIDGGINVNQSDDKNLSPIFWAAKNNLSLIIKKILDKSYTTIDLDTHVLRNKTARDLIEEKKLYTSPLPRKLSHQSPKEKIFALLKLAKEDEFIKYFDSLSLSNPNDFLNLDDGSFTILQYSCERGLTKIGQYLVNRGANVNKVIGNQYKSPLELAADHGYYELFAILIPLPETKLLPKIFCNLLKHSDNPKLDNIDYEKCCEIVLKKLETNRTLTSEIINATDDFHNTPLHYSLRYCNENTSHQVLKCGASLASKNNFGTMPIEDIKPEMLSKHLNDCIMFSLKQNNDEKRDFEVTFDYKSLMPPNQFDKTYFETESYSKKPASFVPETEVIAYMSKSSEFRQFLNHPVIVSFLLLKWHRIRWLFYSHLIFYMLFVSALVVYIFTYYANFETNQSSFCHILENFSNVILNICFLVLVFIECFQLTVSPNKYFKKFENLVEVILIIVTGMILYLRSPSNDTRKELSAIAILLAAFELILMVGQHPKLSTNFVMFKTVSLNFFKLLLWYSLLIIAFALSFYILFTKSEFSNANNGTNTEDDQFMGPGTSLFKTIVMLTGEFDAGSINFQTFPVTSKLIFLIFVFLITIILLNLLNGLAVSDTQTIKNDAELVGHVSRAQHVYYVESMLLGNILPVSFIRFVQKLCCCIPCNENTTYNFLKPLATRVLLFRGNENQQLTVLPNHYGLIFCDDDTSGKPRKVVSGQCVQNCSDTYLDKQSVKRIMEIVKMKRALAGKQYGKTIEDLHSEIISLKVKLDSLLSNIVLSSRLETN